MNLLQPSYAVFVVTGVMIALAFPVTRHIRSDRLRKQYYFLQGMTLVGAVVGAKFSVLIGDHYWPWMKVDDWWAVVWSGRSITGALICGFLFAEIAKPIIGYTMPPNDRFAALLPFSIAIGRVGCLMTGCCRGLPYNGWGAMPGADGGMRYPTQLIEIIFQLTTGIVFVLMLKRGWLYGRLFSLYLVIYGLFRFFTEFIRDTPKFFNGFSGYQALSVVMIALGAAFFLKRTLSPPRGWSEFRTTTNDTLEPSHV